MGDFNAHFNSGGKALDCRAKFLNRLNKVGGLRIMILQTLLEEIGHSLL